MAGSKVKGLPQHTGLGTWEAGTWAIWCNWEHP